MTDPFRIDVGRDRRGPEAYDVARFSLERRAIPVAVNVGYGDLWRAENGAMLHAHGA
jgi:hypothetical protein